MIGTKKGDISPFRDK